MINQIIPALISFVVVAILSPLLIAVLRQLRLIQPIRKELPSNHQLKKGTPLMFGIILFVGIIVSILFSPTPLMYFLSITYILFSFIGFLDDFWKASRQNPLWGSKEEYKWEELTSVKHEMFDEETNRDEKYIFEFSDGYKFEFLVSGLVDGSVKSEIYNKLKHLDVPYKEY